MTAAISFREVSAGGLFERLSFEVESGSSVLIVTSGEDESDALLRLITGMSRPLCGSVHLSGLSLGELSPPQLYLLRQEIGVVPANGGMVSNLKLWENITLPLLYTKGHVSGETEEHITNCLVKLGYSGNVMALPAHLTLYEKRIASFIRATLCQPRIMVYGNCFDDMPAVARKRFLEATTEFHNEAAGRTSIYLVSSAEMAGDLAVDAIVAVHETAKTTTGTA